MECLMRLTVSASLFAVALAFTAPAWAQTTQSSTGSSSMHAPAGSATTGGNSAVRTSATMPRFKTEAEARSDCGQQPVVWANSSSHVLHSASSKYYGKTKRGAYVCENTAMQAGYHMAKGGQ